MSDYSWIDKKFIETSVRLIESVDQSEEIRINDYKIGPAVGKGENFASQLIRVNFTYSICDQVKENSIVIKIDLQNDTVSEELNDFDLFTKEIILYRDIMPEMDKHLKEINLKTRLSPRSYGTSIRPKYIILEDLKQLGYHNFDRQVGLNFEHATLAIKKLAYFHATSAVIGTKNANAFKYHNVKTINPEKTYFIPLFSNLIKECSEACLKWPGFEKYHVKLNKLSKVSVYKGGAIFDRDNTNKFNVLTHSDLWINNIMFKYDELGNPVDALMVDFAITYYGPPGIDLGYFLYSSTANDVQEIEWDKLIRIYYDELKATLMVLKYSKRIPTLTEIHQDILDNAIYGVIFTFITAGLRFLDDIENADIQNLVADTDVAKEWRKTLYSTKRMQTRMEYLLEYFDRKGLLDDDSEF